jgi:hypothetical protein
MDTPGARLAYPSREMVARRTTIVVALLAAVVALALGATVVHHPATHAARCGDPMDGDDSLLAEKADLFGWVDDASEPGDADGFGWASCVKEKE